MNTEQQSRNQKKSHHEDTKTRRNPFCKKTKDFRTFSWERTHLACSGNNRETVSTLQACAPRDDLCVPAVRFGVQALACYGLAIRLERCLQTLKNSIRVPRGSSPDRDARYAACLRRQAHKMRDYRSRRLGRETALTAPVSRSTRSALTPVSTRTPPGVASCASPSTTVYHPPSRYKGFLANAPSTAR